MTALSHRHGTCLPTEYEYTTTMNRQNTLRVISLAGPPATAGFLTVIQAPIGWHLLAWISLVPFLLSCASSALSKRTLCVTAYAAAVVYWLVNIHWISPITLPGWIALCFFLAWTWPVAALTLRYALTKGLPLWLVTAVVIVGMERIQGYPLSSFFWRCLAHSQYENIRLIQIADTLGAAGVSFVIAMVNGLIAGFCLAYRRNRLFSRRVAAQCLLGVATLGGLFAYGHWRVDQATDAIQPGPLVASLQSNVPQSVKDSGGNSDVMFEDLLRQSHAAARAGAELIVWPETTVQLFFDEALEPLGEHKEKWRDVHQKLYALAKNQTHLAIGAYGGTWKYNSDGSRALLRHNSVFFIDRQGKLDPTRYDKMSLVIFGEYMPFRESWPWLFKQLLKCSPYDYDYSLEAGTEPQRFTLNTATESYTFGPLICYEDTIPGIARQFVLNGQDRKQVDWLVILSNDGWFVGFDGDRIRPSGELSQHLAACVFRAVENRISILRSVNTDISGLIDPCGRLHNRYVAASPGFPEVMLERQGIAGWLVDRMPIDKRISLFTRYGQWLDGCCVIAFAALATLSVTRPLRRGRRRPTPAT